MLFLPAGVLLLLLGMGLLSAGLTALAGTQLTALLRRCSGTPMRGLLTGAAVTVLLQSSSAATALTAALAGGGLLPQDAVLPLLLGANIGTTVTPWLLAVFRLGGFALAPLLLLAWGGVLAATGRRAARAALGGGLALLGMNWLSRGGEAVLGTEAAKVVLDACAAHPLWAVLGGTALTAVLQSSAAGIGLLQAAAGGGGLSRRTAFLLVVGQNLGTCSTALLSTLRSPAAARRTAWTHLGVNALGAALWVPLLLAIPAGRGTTPVEIAAFHTGFNAATAGVVLAARCLRIDRRRAATKRRLF